MNKKDSQKDNIYWVDETRISPDIKKLIARLRPSRLCRELIRYSLEINERLEYRGEK